MRMLPFFKPKKGFMMAGGGFETSSGGGGGGGGSSIPDFSTDEIDTGVKWVDGKKIFRKTYVNTEGINMTPATSVPAGINNIGNMLSIVGTYYSGNKYLPINYYESSSTYAELVYDSSNNWFTMICKGYGSSIKYLITAYYTKTTD